MQTNRLVSEEILNFSHCPLFGVNAAHSRFHSPLFPFQNCLTRCSLRSTGNSARQRWDDIFSSVDLDANTYKSASPPRAPPTETVPRLRWLPAFLAKGKYTWVDVRTSFTKRKASEIRWVSRVRVYGLLTTTQWGPGFEERYPTGGRVQNHAR